MNNGKAECTILWFIENYSYCWHKNGEELVSAEFTADGLEGTVWHLTLYPRGYNEALKGRISLFLRRNESDDGPEDLLLKYELSILLADGSALRSDKFAFRFTKGDEYGFQSIVEMDEVLLHRKTDFLPQNTLSVRCKIRMGDGTIQQVKEIIFRNRIGFENISFLHVTESFSKLEPDQKKTVHIRSPSNKEPALESDLFFSDDSCGVGKIMVEITPSNSNKVLSKCKVFLLDSSGTAIKCGEEDYRYDAICKGIRKIPLSLTKQEILKMEGDYLPGDKLSLLMQCDFSTGIEYGKVEKILHEIPFGVLNQLSITDHNEDIYVEKLSKCQSALDDLKEIYSNQFLTDVEIKTETKSFHAHKTLLCARSPVFKTMLTIDMKEKITNCILIEDLENDTVKEFLLFLYTDNIENLEWKSAIKLYYAGDKYAIEKLKILCSAFLAHNVTTCTASELLLLAHTHNDSDLRKIVENFICNHSEQVLDSEGWKNLEKTMPQLVIETMRLIFKRKK